MSSIVEKTRTCCKCGSSSAKDPSITLYRFPNPGPRNILRCELWAKYCFPFDAWSSPNFQKELYTKHKMLCSKHFRDTCFINNKLFRTATPDVQSDEDSSVPIAGTSNMLFPFLKLNIVPISTGPSKERDGLFTFLSTEKRKSSMGTTEMCTPEKRLRTDSNPTPASAPPSPWEANRLKIDLIAPKAQITKLESRINHQHTIRKEIPILFVEEKTSLTDQHKRDERALSDMEDMLQVCRRREQELKDEYSETLKEHKENKANWDREKGELHRQISELKDKLLESNVSSKDQLSEMKRDMDELLQALEGAQTEVEILKKEVAKQTSRAEQCTTLRTQLEKQTFELQQVTSKLKELEYERDSYKDWQQQA